MNDENVDLNKLQLNLQYNKLFLQYNKLFLTICARKYHVDVNFIESGFHSLQN